MLSDSGEETEKKQKKILLLEITIQLNKISE